MTVYKDGRSGAWYIDVRMKGHPRVRRKSPVQNKRGAEKYERKVREELLDGTFEKADEPVPTLGEWQEQFIALHSIPKGLRPNTIDDQRSAFKNHLIPVIGAKTKVDTIGSRQALAVRAAMFSKGLKPKTVKNALDVLSVAVKFYYLSRELPLPRLFENVTVKVPKVPKQFWRPSQYAQLVASASTPEQRVAILLMGDCGLRRGEVIALEWSHIHREPKPHIVVQRSCSGGHWGPTKGGRPRTVPMTTRLVQALDQLPRSIRAPWVLPRVPGGEQPHTSHSLSWLVAMVERNAGLGVEPPKRKDGKGKRSPWGQLHRLRHTYGTRLAAAGVSARNIQELMGHENLKTSAIYIHLIEGAQDSAVAELEAFDHAAAAATEAVAS